MIITGQNKDFHAVWSCTRQTYSVFKGSKWIINVFNRSELKNYIGEES